MTADRDLPRIPPAHRVAHVSVPELLFGPDVDTERRAQMSAKPPDMTLFPAVSATVGVVLSILAWYILGPLAVPLVFATVMTGYGVVKAHVPARHARQQSEVLRSARASGQALVPREDLDSRSLTMLRTVLMAIDQVATSRAYSSGQVPGGLEMLEEQRWRIANALVALTEARTQLGSTGVVLPEQRRAVEAAEEAVEGRVRAVLGYAGSVHDLDHALAAVEAASQADSLDHKLRRTFEALGEPESLSAKAEQAQESYGAVDGALAALRDQTDHLLSFRTPPAGDESHALPADLDDVPIGLEDEPIGLEEEPMDPAGPSSDRPDDRP